MNTRQEQERGEGMRRPLSMADVGVGHLRRLARDEGGAAFVVTLGVFLFIWLVCCGVYTVGETVRRKIQIQNAADAAAYSAAVVQADTLSRMATVNRAMAWTYVQMTRRQMDYIAARWIDLSQKRIDADRDDMRAFNHDWSQGRWHTRHRTAPLAFWCGFFSVKEPKPYLLRDKVFAINNDTPWVANVLQDLVSLYVVPWRCGLFSSTERSILDDMLNLRLMNQAQDKLCADYPEKIEATVQEVVRANLPSDLLSEFLFTCQFKSPRDPQHKWFTWLRNCKEDERRFLSFAGDYYNPRVFDTFNLGVSSGRNSGGVNHWFVRWNDSAGRQENSNAPDQVSVGIQRSYNFNNRQRHDANGSHDRRLQVKQGCGSPRKNRDLDRDANDPSAALVSEYYHDSSWWICIHTPFGWWCRGWSMLPVSSCAFSSSSEFVDRSEHNCQTPFDLLLNATLDFDVRVLTLIRQLHRLSDLPMLDPSIKAVIDAMDDAGLWGDRNCTALGWPGGGRVYGDDPAICNDQFYMGQRCYPVILDSTPQGFFGKGGAILVGVARKARNPWEQITGLGKVEGLFRAFNFSKGVTHLWAVAAARAGYKEWGEKDESRYQLGYTPDNGNDFRYCWNLRQTDWDALFIPVKHAYDYCVGTRGGTPVFRPAGGGNPLQDVMTASWQPLAGGSHSMWGAPSAPPGMSGSLNWGGLNDRMRH